MWLYISLGIDSVTGQTVSAKKRKKGHCDTHHFAERAEGHKGQGYTKCHEPGFSDGSDWMSGSRPHMSGPQSLSRTILFVTGG